jgi:hypothetical protein
LAFSHRQGRPLIKRPRPSRIARSACSGNCNLVRKVFIGVIPEKTYSVLAESERHVLVVTTNLDPNSTKFTENLSDCNLKGLIGLRLEQASKRLVENRTNIRGELTLQQRHCKRGGRQTVMQPQRRPHQPYRRIRQHHLRSHIS